MERRQGDRGVGRASHLVADVRGRRASRVRGGNDRHDAEAHRERGARDQHPREPRALTADACILRFATGSGASVARNACKKAEHADLFARADRLARDVSADRTCNFSVGYFFDDSQIDGGTGRAAARREHQPLACSIDPGGFRAVHLHVLRARRLFSRGALRLHGESLGHRGVELSIVRKLQAGGQLVCLRRE